MAKKNIKELLDTYEEEKEKIWNYLEECGFCTNFDSKNQFCNAYNCYPSKTAVPPEEFCTEFEVDKKMEEQYNRPGKKLQM